MYYVICVKSSLSIAAELKIAVDWAACALDEQLKSA